ncbi:MAG: AEC family transporter [Azospirillum sp.]|nr:AEC family transporter [Azospirillum sp.]
MIPVITALAPIFLLILLGFWLRRRALVADAFWPGAERMTYFLFFPALIVGELWRANLRDPKVFAMAGAMTAGVLAIAVLVLVLRRPLGLDGPAFSSVFQGAMRPNTYVGLAAGKALYGAAGLSLTAVGIAFVVPLVNVLCVTALVHFVAGNGKGSRAVALGLLRNPIIIAVALGFALNLSGIGPQPVIGEVIQALGRVALPVGLLAVGAGLDLAAARAAGHGVLWASLLKLLVLPGLTWGLGRAFGLDGLPLTIAVLFNALPCSASSYVLARQMGGDHRLIAGIITAETLLAALTLPLVLGGAG